ncbi:protein-methionine-sulfoxide reductase heme-binding subunit MsrQ [Terriglobus tenax]|uniref:sulfite oxidase heme-binding subunit YedZ n=1 Tax=Terriglobus tenax TaxID=1111115 RepID=UPI0021E0DC61|nr:protein-methionine-sulfoxide reductase heme-binding subunit MsrQ [Terriglobus tenax]
MNNRTIVLMKGIVFPLCLVPFFGISWAFWQASTGAQPDALGADPVNTLTHWTGDWALWMLLASLAITPLRRLTPKLAWLIRFRRMIGLFAFFYATLHLGTYLFLFSGYDINGAWEGIKSGHIGILFANFAAVWPTIWDDALKRRFVQVGLLSWFILLLLTLTSPQWVLRKMGGKPWQRLHRWVYAAGILAIIHYWWLVKKGVLTPWKDTAVLAILLLARVGWTLWKKRKVPAQAAAPVA